MSVRDSILEIAYELFGEKGYEKTTVTEIVEKAGTSKGGFYHHFKSKEEVLEAIILNYIVELEKYYEEILGDDNLTVIEATNRIVTRINEYKIEQAKDWQKIRALGTCSGSQVYFIKMAQEFEAVTTETYLKLIKRGIKEGVFEVEYLNQVASLWTRELLKIYGDASKVVYANDEESYKAFEDSLAFTEILMNATVGLKDKIKIKEACLEYIQTVKAYVPKG